MGIAEERGNVSILFSDIKGFTKYASQVTAQEVVKMLNDLYMKFDLKCQQYGVYKVETIGDAYFCSANCPMECDDHVKRLIWMGLDMVNSCKEIDLFPSDTEKKTAVQMRIGVHTGTVYAGVVGAKMPRYHLFGHTVLIAEDMES